MRKIPVTVTVIMSRVFHLCSKFFLGNNEAHRQRYLKEILTVEYFTDMDLHSANYFLGIYHETKIYIDAWKTASYTKIFEPVLLRTLYHDISLIVVFFFFSQTYLVLNLT